MRILYYYKNIHNLWETIMSSYVFFMNVLVIFLQFFFFFTHMNLYLYLIYLLILCTNRHANF